ncbi:LANO_0E04258g1_1 [Lachancea nothofagi CBS 11611]|uniref:Heat shock transcription factor n=1 Tax=Lachancea nothofagi CBS 11611 TaxID=1266666 RepID=A0A1G4JS51_9SACH|nr:LANO_0E04258g1_1 [Lachancea nothofagi CBS 11611]
MQDPNTNRGQNSILNEDEIENIINPGNAAGGSGQKSSHPVVEDIVNPSWDPTISMSPGHLEQQNHDVPAPGPFSPFTAHALLAGPQEEHPGDLTRREPPVGFYQAPTSPETLSTPNNESLLSDSILMPYRNRLLKPSTNPQSSLHPKQIPRRKLTSAKTRPAFVNKLWSMVNDTTNQKLIHWSPDGKSFVITNRERFVHEILPKYFKHSNFASFVRQLNMYGWHKVQDVRSGSIQGNSDERWQFENENFVRDNEELLENIIRQKPSTTSTKEILVGQNGEEMDIGILLNELDTVKFNQMAIAEDLKRISKDNESLWKENMMARERHQAQQQALTKILHLLASIMGSNTQKLLGNDLANELAQTNASLNDLPNAGRGYWDFGNMNAAARPRLLLKNSSGDLTSDASRVRESGSNNDYNIDSPIQEIDRQSIENPQSVPSTTLGGNDTRDGSSSGNGNGYAGHNRVSEVPFDSNSPVDNSFFNDLHSNIRKQGESIQELQDWITKISPSQDDVGSLTPSVPDAPSQAQPKVISQESPANFDLQDYLATADPSGFAPLIQEIPPNRKGKRQTESDVEEINPLAAKKQKN